MDAPEQSSQTILSDMTNAPAPLSSHVKKTLEHYFVQLEGYEASGLYSMVISEVEKPLLQVTLDYCGHNQTKAAKILGLSRSTLRKKIEQYHLS